MVSGVYTEISCSSAVQAPECRTVCSGTLLPARGITTATVGFPLGYTVVCPCLLTAGISAARIKSLAPPFTTALSGNVGRVMTAFPLVKYTHLRRMREHKSAIHSCCLSLFFFASCGAKQLEGSELGEATHCTAGALCKPPSKSAGMLMKLKAVGSARLATRAPWVPGVPETTRFATD